MTTNIRERKPTGEPFAEMRGAEFSVKKKTVVDHVDLTINRGELLALVGLNGAGKSSILRLLAGIWRMSEGTVTIDGLDRLEDDLAIRRFTAYLPPDPALHGVSIRENLRIIADAYNVDENVFYERMDSLLRMFDLKEKQDVSGASLSKGELKKACVAAVLVTGARFYILDEPFTGGIDPRGFEALRQILSRLAANREITVVFATQITELASSLADRIAVVNYGRILAVGTEAELRERAGLEEGATFHDVFVNLASKDSDVPAHDYLSALELER